MITDDFRRQLARRVYFTHTAGVPRTTDLLAADVEAYVARQVQAERCRLNDLLRAARDELKTRLVAEHPLLAAIHAELYGEERA